MEQVWKGAALCLVGGIFAALLKKKTPELSIMLSVAVVIVVGTELLQTMRTVTAMIESLAQLQNLPQDLFAPLLKTVAIALVSRLGSDLCRDAGESAMASLLDICGSFGAIVVSIPLFKAAWDMLQSIL